jgi:(p)ppGpp synthase/HD superfamily hydrolase
MYGFKPYVAHLDAVAEIVSPFGEAARIVAYLHDVVEDTPVQIEQVTEAFGALTAECFRLLTDEPGATRKERKARTYAKLAAISGPTERALIVKAADRLANVRACVDDGMQRMWEMYKAEHPVFRSSAYRKGLCEPIWQGLDSLLVMWPGARRA